MMQKYLLHSSAFAFALHIIETIASNCIYVYRAMLRTARYCRSMPSVRL